jgi:hypothetical protein
MWSSFLRHLQSGKLCWSYLESIAARPRQLADWLDAQFAALKKLPRYLIPCYFAPIVYAAYTACTRRVLAQLDPSVGRSDAFIQVCHAQRWKKRF